MKSIHTLAYRERLDRLRILDVCWILYGEHRPVRDFYMISCYSGLLRWGPIVLYYRPERVMWQFGYTHTIYALPVDSWMSYDKVDALFLIGGCTIRIIWFQEVRCALCQVSVPATTWTDSSAFRILS